MAVSSDYANLYVANAGNNTIVHFTIASSGVLTAQNDSVTTTTTPVSIAVNAAGTYLYVISGTTSATLTEYALSSGTINSTVVQTQPLTLSGYTSDTLVSTAVTVLPNNDAVYVTVCDVSLYSNCSTVTPTASRSGSNSGWVFGFAVGTGGVLTATTNSPYQAGVKPSAIAVDPASRYVYVTDYASNQLIGYGLVNTTTLQALNNGPFTTGSNPSAVVVDPRGKYIYVANELGATVTAYAIDLANGTPSVAGSAYATETEPVAIIVDAALGRYVYTANKLDNSISGMELNSDTGAITSTTQATPYSTGSSPSSLVSVPHGNHAIQTVVD
jgi:6-phosphogluconolactonase (cycloisomerase 2 family)